MPLRNDLLNPISADNPTGKSLRYDPLYDQIKEARREDPPDPQGDWKKEIKIADWLQVIKLTSNALATKSKDLQLAVWLAQALLKREGLASFRDALGFILKLMETFWKGLYPEIEEDDLELRKAPLEWFGTESDREPNRPVSAMKWVPITTAGLSYVNFMETREVGTEDAADSWDKQQIRAKKIEEGKTFPEAFEKEFESTPKKFYVELEQTFDETLALLEQIDTFSVEKFGNESPNLRPLQNILIEVRQTVHVLLVRKREKEPDADAPPKEEEVAVEAAADAAPEAMAASAAPVQGRAAAAVAPARAATLTPLPGSMDDAVGRVVAAAKFMRQQNGHNPVPYLMLRALRWGELRGAGTQVDIGQLSPPPPEIRLSLKQDKMDGKWGDVLESAENAMGMECGRGWLDLQRYTCQACQELGGYYEPVRRAVMAELATLLDTFPQLPELTMMDDMPTASAETQAWIKKQVISGRGRSRSEPEEEPGVAGIPSPSRSFEVAMQAAKAGRPEICMELLARELAQEPSGRGRFQRRVQLAQLCQVAGSLDVAIALLQEAVAEIEAKQLEQWESRETLVYPLGMFYRCLVKSDGSTDERDRVYAWICRLDPLEALKLER